MLMYLPFLFELPSVDRYLVTDASGRRVFTPLRYAPYGYVVENLEQLRKEAAIELRWPKRLASWILLLGVLSLLGEAILSILYPGAFGRWHHRLMYLGDASVVIGAVVIWLMFRRGLARLVKSCGERVHLSGADVIRPALTEGPETPDPAIKLRREVSIAVFVLLITTLLLTWLTFGRFRLMETAVVAGVCVAGSAWFAVPRAVWLAYLTVQSRALAAGRTPPAHQPRRAWLFCLIVCPLALILTTGVAIRYLRALP